MDLTTKDLVRVLAGRIAMIAALAAVFGIGSAGLGHEAPRGLGLTLDAAAAKSCPGARANPGKIKAVRASRATICLINRQRARRGLPRLKLRKPLRAAAKRQSRRMVRRGCFSHSCGGALYRRVHRTRYLPCGCAYRLGETLAWGSGRRGKPIRIVRKWMQSSGHRAILLERRFRHIGVGVVWGAPGNPGASRSGTYTAILGSKG